MFYWKAGTRKSSRYFSSISRAAESIPTLTPHERGRLAIIHIPETGEIGSIQDIYAIPMRVKKNGEIVSDLPLFPNEREPKQ